jgi:hypothetical protein
MPITTVLDCARCAKSAYSVDAVAGPGLTQAYYGDLANGFKGSYYCAARGGALGVICAFAGTEPNTWQDLLADVGFGGAMGAAISPALAAAGINQLAGQLYGATEMARQAQYYAQLKRAPLIIVGHSLGGGLATMVACSLGVPCITFSAPATSQLGYRAPARASFRNVAIDGDFINATLVLGNRIGSTWLLRTGRVLLDAHSINNTITALSAGPYAPVGSTTAL